MAAGVFALAHALKHNTHVTWLSVSNNPLGRHGAQSLAFMLQHNAHLTHLAMHNCALFAAGGQVSFRGAGFPFFFQWMVVCVEWKIDTMFCVKKFWNTRHRQTASARWSDESRLIQSLSV